MPRRLRILLLCLPAILLIAGRPAQAQPPPIVTGAVVDGATGDPVPGASVESETETITAGPDGRFAITLAPGDTELRITAGGYLDAVVVLDPAAAGPRPALEVLLFRNTFAETVQVVSPRPAPERPSATPVETRQVQEAAGAFDNVFRTLALLPGVSLTGDFNSRLAVRGGTPDQNLTVMDGVEIHNPFRLFGLVSAFNPETVERFELTAGGFGAAYGDRLSSLLVVDNRAGGRAFEGSSSSSVTDANVVLEGAAPGGGSWLVSGRRTYYDLVAGLFTDQNLPSFADAQMQGDWTFGPGHRLSVFGLTSRENSDFSLEEQDDPESRDSGRLTSEAGNDLASLRLETLLGAAGTARTIVSWYRNTDLIDIAGTFESDARRSNTPDPTAVPLSTVAFDRTIDVRDLSLRQEFALSLAPAHALDVGVELHRLASRVGLSITGDRNETAANPSSVQGGTGLPAYLDSSLGGTRGGAWIQDRWTLTPRLSVEPGLRLDWSTVNGGAVASPRFAATVTLGRGSRLRAAGGLYTQSPGYEKLIQSDYFFDLSPEYVSALRHERATHLVAGFERDLGPETLARVEGYYKRFDDLIVGRLESETSRRARVARYDFPAGLRESVPAAARITSTPVNGGGGAAYGIDAYLARTAPGTRLTGWLSYAWGRADRETYGLRYPFEYDRRHAFNAVGRYRLNDRWSAAATAQVASGFPYTPATGLRVAAQEDARGRLVPARDAAGALVYGVDLGGLDHLQRGRLPLYARVDLRIGHQPGGRAGRWSWYVEVINLLNRDNPVALETNLAHDPGAVTPRIVENPTAGFPIIPSFGVRVRF